MKQTLELRFWDKVDKAPGFGRDGDCWKWTAQTLKKGYGRFATGKYTKVLAHRMAFELVKGAIPAGLLVLHSCDNPRCVNPAHLSAGTHKDNVADMFSKGRQSHNLPHASSSELCGRGHSMTPENTISSPSGKHCRACKKLRSRLYRAGKTVADLK